MDLSKNIIPPITDPLGKSWRQPHPKYIVLDENYAAMSKQTFLGLPEYSDTNPTGVYAGKMWRAHRTWRVREKDGTFKTVERWELCWYYDLPQDRPENTGYVGIAYREILIVE